MGGKRTMVIGIAGALGKINFTSSNFCRRRQFSARPTQPAPLSPRPWAMITVAVCRLIAGTMSAVGGGILFVCFVVANGKGARLIEVGERKCESLKELNANKKRAVNHRSVQVSRSSLK